MENIPDKSLIPLELLVPWELPLDQNLSPTDRVHVSQALRQLLQALAESSSQRALLTINQALKELSKIETQIANIESTKTALKAWEVQDYDRYFQIRHVHTQQSGICLIKGLLITCQRFVGICLQSPWLDDQQVELQKQGFVSYIQLLIRTFDLDKPESS
ncbi:MAG: hypothetical protein AAFW75_10470 [Cyanobacteria bacterium J06636_16]